MMYEWFEEVSSISSNDVREQHERARRTAGGEITRIFFLNSIEALQAIVPGRFPRRLRLSHASIRRSFSKRERL